MTTLPVEAAIELLRTLSTDRGIRASLSDVANYQAVFTRDAVMAGIAGVLVDDPIVQRSLVATLERLRALQGPEGQIASNYALAPTDAPPVSFGSLVPRLDAATWYLVGVSVAIRAGLIRAGEFRESADAVAGLLDAIEYNGRHLLYVPAGGNWADEYLLEGYILSDQILRAWGLRLASTAFGRDDWRAKSEAIEQVIGERFWPHPGQRRPIASFTPLVERDLFDLSACALLGTAQILPARAQNALEWIDEEYLQKGTLPPAFAPTIAEDDAGWPALQRYHLFGFRNRPDEYHNGGIWPIWLGWLGVAFTLTGRTESCNRLRHLVAECIGDPRAYRFAEYWHGRTLAPAGTLSMGYSASGVVLLSTMDTPRLRTLFGS